MESLARATLDTLPFNIAILDVDGEIFFTNESWCRFGTMSGMDESYDSIGSNYLDVAEAGNDVYAREASEGIRSVLAGERDVFTLEYPCHSPEEKRWFLMRVSRFSADDETRAVVAHIDITERKLAELESEEHARTVKIERRNLEHLVDRINGLIQDIADGLMQATTRSEIERCVCDGFADADPYVLVWIGEPDVTNERLVPTTAAGDLSMELDEIEELLTDPEAAAPSMRALEEREIQVIQDIDAEGLGDNCPHAAAVRAMAAIPLVYKNAMYGVLHVYADRANVFDERERTVLAALAHLIANSINAVESNRILTTDRIIELELKVRSPEFLFSDLSTRAGCAVAYEGSVYRDDGTLLVFLTTSGTDADAVADHLRENPEVAEFTNLIEHDDEQLFEVEMPDSIIAELADYGAITRDITAEGGEARITIELPYESNARSLFELVEDRYDDTELIGYHERERPAQTRQEFKQSIEERLTDRQRTALRTAFLAGFFDWPRPITGDELAASMDITRPTFHQHLRAAERKLLEELFG